MASMVVIACPTAALTGVTHDRLGIPSRCTVQAPQSATPQPNFVPFMPSRSRRTHRSGMSDGASTLCDLPLILSVTMSRLRSALEEKQRAGQPSLPRRPGKLLVPDQQSPGICRRGNDWPHPNVPPLVGSELALLERRLRGAGGPRTPRGGAGAEGRGGGGAPWGL